MTELRGFQAEKQVVRAYFDALEKCTPDQTVEVLQQYMSDDYFWEGPFPFMDKCGIAAVADEFWKPLKESMQHLQRRQDIFIAGVAALDGNVWVMSMGQFRGNFAADILGIRHTNKVAHVQYAEYSLVKDGKITHTAMFMDLIGLMQQAGMYPLTPMTGTYFVYPGPRDHNGLLFEDAPAETSAQTLRVVEQMIDELQDIFAENITSYAETYPKLQRTWAEDMTWYGPCGEGAGYTIQGYQRQHHHPFCDDMPSCTTNDIHSYFAEGDFACFFCSMETHPAGGWLGMPGGTENVHMRGDIDIYYVKDSKISENWCFIDIPFWLNEQGVNVFERTAEIYNS